MAGSCLIVWSRWWSRWPDGAACASSLGREWVDGYGGSYRRNMRGDCAWCCGCVWHVSYRCERFAIDSREDASARSATLMTLVGHELKSDESTGRIRNQIDHTRVIIISQRITRSYVATTMRSTKHIVGG